MPAHIEPAGLKLELLNELEDVKHVMDEAQVKRDELIVKAFEAGVTKTAIGKALGITQAAASTLVDRVIKRSK
ncbi:MAG: hypothetical protein QM613_03705 [Micrococcaceae bacterium]